MNRLPKLSFSRDGRAPQRVRSVGRVLLWTVLVLLLYRGAVSVALDKGEPRGPVRRAEGGAVQFAPFDAFAVHFARAYIADSSRANLAELLANGASIPAGGGPTPQGQHVAQATVAAIERTSSGTVTVTVACELQSGEVLNLAVPIARDSAGGVAAVGAPAFVAAPGKGRTEAERSQPIPGADAEAISQLATRFVETYLSGTSAADLEYLTPPGSQLAPLGGLEPTGPIAVGQLGDEMGRSRTVLARVTVRTANGAVYPLGYRLRLDKRDRWYVTSIEGEAK
jgi:hypothetical protein